MNKQTLEAGFYRYFFRFIAKNGYEVEVTPYQAAIAQSKVRYGPDLIKIFLRKTLKIFGKIF